MLIGDTIFYVCYWGRDSHFARPCEPREGLPVCRAKEVPSFLGCFKTPSIGPARGIEPATSRSAVERSTDLANPAAQFWFVHKMQRNWLTTWFSACSVLIGSLSMKPRRRRHQRPHLKKKYRRSLKLHRSCFITLNLSNVREFFGSWVLKVCISVKKKKRKIVILR